MEQKQQGKQKHSPSQGHGQGQGPEAQQQKQHQGGEHGQGQLHGMEQCANEVLEHTDHLHGVSVTIVDLLGTIQASSRHHQRYKMDSPHITSDDARLLVHASSEKKEGSKWTLRIGGEDFGCEKMKRDIFARGGKHHLALFPEAGGRFFIIVIAMETMKGDDQFEGELGGVFNKFKNVLNADKSTMEHEHLVADLDNIKLTQGQQQQQQQPQQQQHQSQPKQQQKQNNKKQNKQQR